MIQVLLVEDDQGVSDLVGYILESDLGAAVCFATTGRVAVDAMEFGAFDLAIIDVTVSGLSGFDLAKRAVDRFIPSRPPPFRCSVQGWGTTAAQQEPRNTARRVPRRSRHWPTASPRQRYFHRIGAPVSRRVRVLGNCSRHA